MEIIPRTEDLWVYGFNPEKWTIHAGVPALTALFECLKGFQATKGTPPFPIWLGDFNHIWWIGVPQELTEEATASLYEAFQTLDGFETMEAGSVPDMTLLPTFKYTDDVVYTLHEIAGGDVYAVDYGSGVPVAVLDCMITDREN